MDKINHLRLSALAPLLQGDSHYLHQSEHLEIVERPNFTLHQIAVWPDSVAAVASDIASRFGTTAAKPGCWRALLTEEETVLWIEPFKFWQIGGEVPSFEPHEGHVLDLSDSRTWIRLSGAEAQAALSSRLPVDLRFENFSVGSVASTVVHGVGVTIWKSGAGYEMLLPRSFARSIAELILFNRKFS